MKQSHYGSVHTPEIGKDYKSAMPPHPPLPPPPIVKMGRRACFYWVDEYDAGRDWKVGQGRRIGGGPREGKHFQGLVGPQVSLGQVGIRKLWGMWDCEDRMLEASSCGLG